MAEPVLKPSASIQWKLVFIYVLVIVVVMQAVSIYLISDIQKMLENSFEEGLRNTAVLLVQKLADKVNDQEYLTEILDDELRYQRPNPEYVPETQNYDQDYQIFVFDPEFKQLYGDEEMYWVNDILYSISVSEETYQSSIRKHPISGNRYQNSCVKIIGEDGTQGYVYIVAAMEQQVYSKVSDIRSIMLMGTGITLLISMVLSLALAGTITRPIKELTLSAAEMARGNFSQQIEVHSADEIGQLGQMFNSMAGQLNQTLGEISNEKSKMDAIFTYMSNGVIAFDIAGELIHINPRAKELLVLSDKEDAMLVAEIIEKLQIENILQTVNFNRLSIREISLPFDGGRIIRVQQAPFQREERLNGVIMVLEDITELQKLDRMRREFIANVSHELKTPLTNIQIRIQTLQEYLNEHNMTPPQLINAINAGWRMLNIEKDKVQHFLPEGAESVYDLTYDQLQDVYKHQIQQLQQKMLPVVEAETTRMNKLVRDLLQLSQLDSEHVELNKRQFDIQYLLLHVVDTMSTTAKEKDMVIECEMKAQIKEVVADRDAIEQVIVNIISNAIKYSPSSSSIKVSLTSDDQYAWISIKDNGIGIPAQDLPRIFERFYRVDKARSRQLGGTGLGLSIAKQIVEAHGGKIEIFSDVGMGTEVLFSVPIAKWVEK